MAGFEDIGGLLGVPANNELSYQKGLALGANTQNAMQQARERVRQNTAMEKLATDTDLAHELGLSPGLLSAAAGGVNIQQLTGASGDMQERGFRSIAGSSDPNVDAGARNRALAGLTSGPVETYKAVGSKGYQDVFHPEQGVVPLGPEFNIGAGGGDAAAIQVLRAFGFLDAAGHVDPARAAQAFDVMRTTGHVVDEGGVAGVTDFNPFAGGRPGVQPPARNPAAPAVADPLNLAADLAPPPPAAAPPAAPMPAAPGVAGTGAVTPISSAGRVAGNVAQIEKAKVVGKGAGDATVAAPGDLAEIDKLSRTVGDFGAMPGFDSVYGNIQGQPGVKSVMGVLSQDTANAQAALQNLDAQTFGISIDNMRGMGALSNQEGARVTDAFSTLSNTKQDPTSARKAITLINKDLATARQRIQTKTLLPVQGGGGAALAPAPAGAVSPYPDAAKEARYQAWKAAQGSK